MKPAILLFVAGTQLFSADSFTWWIQPCAGIEVRCEEGDEQLARWALEAWQKASNGGFTISPGSESRARIRVYWATGREGLYGETHTISVEGRPGAEMYIRPTLDGLGPGIAATGARDKLFRQTIVYLTALHELGHAFGLPHTRGFDDIMYNFAFGGDFLEYFARYRRKLTTRDSIPSFSGLSDEDVRRIRLVYPATN